MIEADCCDEACFTAVRRPGTPGPADRPLAAALWPRGCAWMSHRSRIPRWMPHRRGLGQIQAGTAVSDVDFGAGV